MVGKELIFFYCKLWCLWKLVEINSVSPTATNRQMPALISSSTVSLSSLDCCPIYLIHLHLQSGEQSTFALTHLQTEQSPLQEHLISSLHDLNTSGIVIQTGTHDPDTLVQEKSCGEGTTSCVCLLVVQIPAWFTVRWTCCRSTSLVGGSLSIARLFWQKSPLLVSLT